MHLVANTTKTYIKCNEVVEGRGVTCTAPYIVSSSLRTRAAWNLIEVYH